MGVISLRGRSAAMVRTFPLLVCCPNLTLAVVRN